ELVLLPPVQAPDGLRCFLGIDGDGRAYFSVTAPLPSAETVAGPASGSDGQAPGGSVKPAALRQVGALLGDRDAGLFTQAVALANWHTTHTHCPRCGAVTEPIQAGYARRCPVDGSEHFPRVDPAVIMLVRDDGDRCLLARNRNWPPRRVSILA